jgi:hypothetical protein
MINLANFNFTRKVKIKRKYRPFKRRLKRRLKFRRISYSKILRNYNYQNINTSLIVRLFIKQFNTRGNTQRSLKFFYEFLYLLKKRFLKKVVRFYKKKFYKSSSKYMKFYKKLSKYFNVNNFYGDFVKPSKSSKFNKYIVNINNSYENFLYEYNCIIESFFVNFDFNLFVFFQSYYSKEMVDSEKTEALRIKYPINDMYFFSRLHRTFKIVYWKIYISNTEDGFVYLRLQKFNYLLLYVFYLIKRNKFKLDGINFFRNCFFMFIKFILQVKNKSKKVLKKYKKIFFKNFFLKARAWSIFTIFKTTVWFNRNLVILKSRKKAGAMILLPFPLLNAKNQISFFYKNFFNTIHYNFPKYMLKQKFFKLKDNNFLRTIVSEFFYLSLFKKKKSLYLFQFQKKLKNDLKINRGNLRFIRNFY